MMGGDFAPVEAVKGLQRYLSTANTSVKLFCIGDEEQVKPLLAAFGLDDASIVTIYAAEIIGMNEHPTKALKEKSQSSITIGFNMLATGKIDAFISAGNTGAMLVGAMYSIKPTPCNCQYSSKAKWRHGYLT